MDQGATSSILHMEQPPTLRSHLSVKAVYKIAREYAIKNLPNETYQAYPIPVHNSGGINLVFLWGVSRAVPGEGRHYISPHWMVTFEFGTGEFVLGKRVSPADFGQSVTPGQFIGTRDWKMDLSIKNRGKLERRLYELYDILLPEFAKGKSVEVSLVIRNTAIEFKKILDRLSQKFLRPYYCEVGHDFYVWMDDVAKSVLPAFCPKFNS
ncbi:MAG: hypothetical protein GXP08_02050 [Gammaproteobacteria bacterium]|nr:hypothetical protein [Gammaproteobacteria bacterium]